MNLAHALRDILSFAFGKLTQKRRCVFATLLICVNVYGEIPLKNVPIRHLLNEESLFISRLRFAIKEVKLRYNVSPYGNLIEAWNYTLLHFQLYIPQIFYYIYVFYISNYVYSFCALNAYITCTILYNCAIKTHLVLVDVKDGMCTRKTGHNNKEGKRKGVTKKIYFFSPLVRLLWQVSRRC